MLVTYNQAPVPVVVPCVLSSVTLVKWLGYGPEHNTWEPEANLTNCSEVLPTFWDAARILKAPAPAKDQQSG